MSTQETAGEITGRGQHDNGARLDVRIGPYTGAAGIEKTAEGTLRAAFFAELTRDLRAAKGSPGEVGGQALHRAVGRAVRTGARNGDRDCPARCRKSRRTGEHLMPSLLALPATAFLAVVGPNGPVLEPKPAVERVEATAPVQPAEDDAGRCVRRWRLIHAGAQAADVATTVYAVESGKGTEANPLIRALLGKRPKAHELIAFKAVNFGLIEWQAQGALARGDSKAACRAHKIGAVITGGVAALNLRVVFR